MQNQMTVYLNFGMFDKFELRHEDQRGMLMGMELGLVTRTVSLVDLPKKLEERMKVTPEIALEMAKILWRDFCGPFGWYWSDLPEFLKKYNLDVSVNGFSIEQPRVGRAALLAEIMAEADDALIKIKDKFKKYLAEIINGGEFNEATVMKKMTDSITVQGYAFGIGRAEKIIKVLRDRLGSYDIFDDSAPPPAPVVTPVEPVVSVPASAVAVPAVPAATTPVAATPAPLGELLSPAEKKEVVDTATLPTNNLSATEEALVDAVLLAAPLEGRGEEMQKKWRQIILARLKNVRDAASTARILSATVAAGGLELPAAEAERLAGILEKTLAGLNARQQEISVVEKIASVQARTKELAKDPDQVQSEKQAELNKRFVGLFGKKAVAEIRAETHRELMTEAQAHPNGAPAKIAIVVPTPAAPPPVPVNMPSAPPAPPASAQYTPKVPERLKQIINAEQPYFSGQPVATPPAKAVLKTGDIRPPQRMMNPIDELRAMTLVDWRRLSPDASVRVQKIRSKIEAAGADGAPEKLRAISAVQESEPIKVYREILRASIFQQQSFAEAATARKENNLPTLDTAEEEAIRALLDAIRYSIL